MGKANNPITESQEGFVVTDQMFQDIKDEFEATFLIPDKKPTHQYMLCPVGLVGAGKSTVIQALTEQLPVVTIRTDEIRMLLQNKKCALTRTREMAFDLIEKYLRLGYSIAIDADCVSPDTAEYIKQLDANFDLKFIWLHIFAPEDVILERLRTTTRRSPIKNSDDAIAIYTRRKALHKNLTMPFTYVFDTTKKNIDSQIQEAVQIINNI